MTVINNVFHALQLVNQLEWEQTRGQGLDRDGSLHIADTEMIC